MNNKLVTIGLLAVLLCSFVVYLYYLFEVEQSIYVPIVVIWGMGMLLAVYGAFDKSGANGE